MANDSFDRGLRQNRGPLPLGEILKDLSHTHQDDHNRGESPIAKATSDLLNRALNSSYSHSEAVGSQVNFKLAGGTLADQKERLPTDDPTQTYITDLLLDAHQAFKQLRDHPNIKEALCDYLIRPGLIEQARFATRELLEVYCKEAGIDTQVKESMLLAEALAILEKPLKNDSGEMRLDDLRYLTQKPKLWISLLDNLIDGTVRGSNHHLVIDCLKDNLALLCDDSLIQIRLASLKGATDEVAKRIHDQLFDIPQSKEPEGSPGGPTFGINDLL